MEQFVPRVGLSARSAQSSASPVALVGPCGAVGGRSTGRSPSRCWNGVEPPTLRLAVIVDQAFSNVSYSEPGVNQYNDPARNCQYVPRPGLMTQGELTTYCNSGGPFATVGHDVVRGGTIPDITAGSTAPIHRGGRSSTRRERRAPMGSPGGPAGAGGWIPYACQRTANHLST